MHASACAFYLFCLYLSMEACWPRLSGLCLTWWSFSLPFLICYRSWSTMEVEVIWWYSLCSILCIQIILALEYLWSALHLVTYHPRAIAVPHLPGVLYAWSALHWWSHSPTLCSFCCGGLCLGRCRYLSTPLTSACLPRFCSPYCSLQCLLFWRLVCTPLSSPFSTTLLFCLESHLGVLLGALPLSARCITSACMGAWNLQFS